jgi:hypothetical protein
MWTSIIKPVLLQRFAGAKHAAVNVVTPSRFHFGVENAMLSAR